MGFVRSEHVGALHGIIFVLHFTFLIKKDVNMKKIKASAMLVLASASGASFAYGDSQVGMELKKEDYVLSSTGETEKLKSNSFGASLKHESYFDYLFLGTDNRFISIKKGKDVKNGFLIESKIYSGICLEANSGVKFLPYVGIGVNSLKKKTDDGSEINKISREVFFVPIGLMAKFSVMGFTVKPLMEYDFILKAKSSAKDITPGSALGSMNSKPKGYGLKGGIEFAFGDFSVMPFVHYWDLKSNNTYGYFEGNSYNSLKVRSKSHEYGIRVGYNF